MPIAGERKSELPQVKTKLLACAVVVEELRTKLPSDIECEILDFGLHRSPELLRAKLQETIDRADDCIAIFLGSREAYLKEQDDHPGSLFLSKGWIEGRIDDLSPDVAVLQRLVSKYGEERALRMLEIYQARQPLRHYRRLAFITTSGEANLDHYKDVARARAAGLGLRYDEIQGSTAFMEKIAGGTWDDAFVVASPGSPIAFDDFWR
jgi:hypothetical protein